MKNVNMKAVVIRALMDSEVLPVSTRVIMDATGASPELISEMVQTGLIAINVDANNQGHLTLVLESMDYMLSLDENDNVVREVAVDVEENELPDWALATECWDCLGSGTKKYYHMVDNGVCYTCNGTGRTTKPKPNDSHSDEITYCECCGCIPCHAEMEGVQ